MYNTSFKFNRIIKATPHISKIVSKAKEKHPTKSRAFRKYPIFANKANRIKPTEFSVSLIQIRQCEHNIVI